MVRFFNDFFIKCIIGDNGKEEGRKEESIMEIEGNNGIEREREECVCERD